MRPKALYPVIILLFFFVFFVGCSEKTTDETQVNSKSEALALEQKIDSIVAKMTLTEKIGQTAQRGTSSRSNALSEELKQAVREGRVGSCLNVMNDHFVDTLQRIAIEESPNGIPLIFARDVIHGFKTIFPIPLGQAASWNPEQVKEGARIAAIEASSAGIRWTFAPMLDISRDARWGRIAESSGEDPYLTSTMGQAYIQGFQGESLSDPTSIAACAKHMVGYGAAEGGRDYNTVVLSEDELNNTYLRPFKAAVEADVATVMSSFNELNGIPLTGNEAILKTKLKSDFGFDGFVVSDWNSVTEMIAHGYVENPKEAALQAAKAGLDMEMTSTAYSDHLETLIQEGKITEEMLDQMVRNILRIKFKLGLFDAPFYDKSKDKLYAPAHLEAAEAAAIESMVLLKNKNNLLPLRPNQTIALIGPMADAPLDQLGTWIFDGEAEHTITPKTAMESYFGTNALLYAPGLHYSRDSLTTGFDQALATAKRADIIVFCAGEEAILSGEAHSRAHIQLPGKQEALIKALAKTGKPIVLVIMAGRPITLENIKQDIDALIMAWHPGTMGGPALSKLLSGKVAPSGKLPLSWPKSVGQIPMHYNHKNTGRPATEEAFVPMHKIPIGAWQSSLGNDSHYLDDGFTPEFPFGFGLTYSSLHYSEISLSDSLLYPNSSLTISATIANTGDIEVKETVQLYVQDRFGSITRPVKELKGFKKITLAPQSKKSIQFKINASDLAFFNGKDWVTEVGEFKVWVAPHSASGVAQTFKYKEEQP